MLKKSTANPNPPLQADAGPRGKNVPIAPKINADTGNQADGAKRVINTEAKPSKTSSTYTAPRSNGGGSPMTDGFTKLDMYTGGNGKGNGKR